MSKFEKVIGYEAIKGELMQICDMVKNADVYERLGAKLPKGILLYGEPGLGKTLMAKCFVEECGLETFVIRKNKSENFVEHITQMFKKAKQNAPSVIFLDDMDKFANEDGNYRDAEEYVAVQSGIDEVKESTVFVIATANEVSKLPRSLTRSGRFDKKIEVYYPKKAERIKIIEYYLSDKKIDKNINVEDVSKMLAHGSCAELESILNEAAIIAAYQRKSYITMKELIKAVLNTEYGTCDEYTKASENDIKKVAIHEAGHLVVSEILSPESVGMASLRNVDEGKVGGFVRRCEKFQQRNFYILVSLAGKAAAELYFAGCSEGCDEDISRAVNYIKYEISEKGELGFGMIDVGSGNYSGASENFTSRNESVIQAMLERYFYKVKEILLENKRFLEIVTEELMEKGTLIASDIRNIKESIGIV